MRTRRRRPTDRIEAGAGTDRRDGVGSKLARDTDGSKSGGMAMAFRDNGDGTVTDDRTGLMWEKKSPLGSGSGDVHNMTFGYSWSQPGDPAKVTGTEPDGSIFTIFLRNLNENAFAGHSDWRLPTRQELL